MLDDVPRADETIHVYEAVPGTNRMLPDTWIVCVRGPGGLQQAAGASGEYRHRPDVDGETVRETAAWRAWVTAEPEAVPA
jgi:hypothetical protein